MPKLTSKFQNSGKETVFLVIFQLFITKFRSIVFEMKKGHFWDLLKVLVLIKEFILLAEMKCFV